MAVSHSVSANGSFLLRDMTAAVPSFFSFDALAHCSSDAMSVDLLFSSVPPSSAPLLLPADWDLASIESSLSSDPSLNDLLSSTGGDSSELDPLELGKEFSAYINYQFDYPDSAMAPHSSPNAMSNPSIYSNDHIFQRQQNLLLQQCRRNAQIVLRLSPYRKLQEKLQTMQRRQTQQKTKRKFSLKNGPIEQLGARREAMDGRFRGNSNSSARRWRREMGAMISGPKAKGTSEGRREGKAMRETDERAQLFDNK